MEKIEQKIKVLYPEKSKSFKFNADKLVEYGLKDITLRDYQLDGVNWLVQRYQHGHGCILADEMGLGKTCQTIAFLVYLAGSKEGRGPHLVVSPLSVLGNWQNELSRFAPHLAVAVYVGDKDKRAEIRENISGRAKPQFDVLLTTYELCMKDESFLRRYSWNTLLVDEGHRLKNRESLLHQILVEFDIEHRVLLSGTPVQNNLKELCALLTFVAPQVFKPRYTEDLVEKYADINISDDMSKLHDVLKPFLLRRIKAEVVKDLPSKSELVMYHGLSVLQKKYYKAILTKDLEAFENPHQTTKTRLMNVLMQLRKCVDHPYLFDGVEPEPFELGDHLVEASGKLVLIDQLLSYLQAKGHKVLLFSQMTRMLDILQDYLGYRGYSYERLDGSVRGEERYLAVQNFNEDDGTFIFLLSTKAGGQGLNLVGADTVIFVDSDFNPQNDLQAAARAHRIGQTRPVKVIRLIGRSTVEEIVLRRAEAKLKLTHSVIEGGQFSSITAGSSKEELIADNNLQLQDILKFGVDKLFADEESTLEEVNFSDMLGPTVDGEWQVEEMSVDAQAGLASLAEPDEEAEETQDKDFNMYEFEGKDYSKEPSAQDKKVFEQLIAAEKAVLEASSADKESRALRRHQSVNLAGVLPDLPTRKPRKKLSPEELAARRKKREEAAARRAKEEEEEEVRQAQHRRQVREKLWKENGYSSCNILLASDGESEDEEEEEGVQRRDLGYLVGDVTHPQKAGKDDVIIVHCVDDSGSWGVGGLFSAIAARSAQPEEQYQLAGKVRDLALGDAHLVSIDDRQSRDVGNDYLALAVSQHRDRKNNLSGIKMTALSQALQRIYQAAKQKKASVHLPRIGHNTPGFNWYGTERLIRKHLASRGIPTYMYPCYYYPRKHAMKRKATTKHGNGTKHKYRRRSSDSEQDSRASTSTEAPISSTLAANSAAASAFSMEGVCVHFHGLEPKVAKRYTQLLVAHDGDLHRTVEDSTTHLVTTANLPDKEKLAEYAEGFEDLQFVSLQWLEDCFTSRKQLRVSEKYKLSLD